MATPPVTGCDMLLVTNSLGLCHAMSTVTGTSTAGLKSMCIVQVRLTADPTGRTGLEVLLDKITEVGAGTVNKTDYYSGHKTYETLSLLSCFSLTFKSDILRTCCRYCDVITEVKYVNDSLTYILSSIR